MSSTLNHAKMSNEQLVHLFKCDELKQVKDLLANGTQIHDISTYLLIKAGDIRFNSVGYYHFSQDGTHYDLYQLCEKLMAYYSFDSDPVRHQIYSELYERNYWGCDEDG